MEICGGIASGKTSLCAAMKEYGWKAQFENFHKNPFWSLFYQNPQRHAFETEITFLLQHYSQLKVAADDAKKVVCDFSLIQDCAYAELNLNAKQLEVFYCVHEEIAKELFTPTILVHLRCSPEEEMARISHRARPEEGSITVQYLSALNCKIEELMAKVGTRSQIFLIDSERYNFVTDQMIRREVILAINNMFVGKRAPADLPRGITSAFCLSRS